MHRGLNHGSMIPMGQAEGRLVEIKLEGETVAGRIACPDALRPAPGQYLVANRVDDPMEALAYPLFPTGMAADLSPIPDHWAPGARLALRGPLGHGFHLPSTSRRVCLAAYQCGLARLLPLAVQALEHGAEVTLVMDALPPVGMTYHLPAVVEVVPFEAFPEALAWADSLALDTPAGSLEGLLTRFRLEKRQAQALNAQVLVDTPLPCSGLADCGVCAVPASRSWALACKDGPVFDLAALMGERS